jgi:hypothetical protein
MKANNQQQPKRLVFTTQLNMLMFLACLPKTESKKFTQVGEDNEMEYFESQMSKPTLGHINNSTERFDYKIIK